jgi:DNA-binding XRE family transcriptional regulator
MNVKEYYRKRIGERIVEARIKHYKGTVSQKDMAKILDVPYKTYQNWEIDKSLPKHEMIIVLANKLKVDPGELIFGQRQRIPPKSNAYDTPGREISSCPIVFSSASPRPCPLSTLKARNSSTPQRIQFVQIPVRLVGRRLAC